MNEKKNRRLKGSVLFTVVSVLSLLIIFLMGTIVLAVSANNRAHKTYSSSQTQYTARAAVDGVLAAVAQDEVFAEAVNSLGAGGKFTVDISMDDPSLGRIDKALLAYEGTTEIYDSIKQEWVTKDLISISVEATLGSGTRTLTSYVIKDPVIPETESPGFLTMGEADIANHTHSFGGTYLGMGRGYQQYRYISDGSDDPINHTPVKLEDKKYLSGLNLSLANENVSEAPFVADGSLDVATTLEVYVPVKGKGVQVWGDLNIKNNKFSINSKTLDFTSNYSFKEVPYLYVDGEITANNNFTLGTGTFPLNIFCGSIQATDGDANIYADVYCHDKNSTTNFTCNNSNLYNWTDSIANGTSGYNSFGGNFYSKGNLKVVKNAVFNGDVCIEGNASIKGNVTIKGNLIVGGNLDMEGVTVTTRAENGSIVGGNVVCKGNAKIRNSNLSKDLSIKGKSDCDAASLQNVVNIYNGSGEAGETFTRIKAEYDFYQNEYHHDEMLPGYQQIENTYHENSLKLNFAKFTNPLVDASLVEEYTPKWTETTGGPTDKYGNPVPDYARLYYVESGTSNEQCFREYPRNLYVVVNEVGEIAPHQYTTQETIYYNLKTGAEVTEFQATGSYYTKHDDPTAETDQKYCYHDAAGNEVDKSEAIPMYFYTRPEDSNSITYDGITFYLTADPAKTPVTESEATEVITIGSASADPYKNIEIYPPHAEQSVILGLETLDDGSGGKLDKSTTQVIQTVKEVMENWNFEGKAITQLDPSIIFQPENIYDAGTTTFTQPLEIKANSVLKGSFNNTSYAQNLCSDEIVITPPANGTIWVVLEDFKTDNNKKIIIDDTAANAGKVCIFVKGKTNYMGSGSCIVTKTYQDIINNLKDNTNTTKYYINTYENIPKDPGAVQLKKPEVYVYSEKDAVFKASDGFYITANVQAPYMMFECKVFGLDNFSKNRISYNGLKLSDTTTNLSRLGVVGCMNVKEGSYQNDWVLLHVKDNGGKPPISSADGRHTYAAVNYVGFEGGMSYD